MFLSRLQLFGFKSFLQRLDLKFDGQICALVGPNGCGKTNVVDALRWVLGEQRPTLLRGERMEEIIFHGTKTRKPLGMAEVTLTIDNSAHLLPLDFSEVTIARRLFRSGESEYLLNRIPHRLKDIHHLLYDTGIGACAYSILSREQIDNLLSSKEEEKRVLLEEAAGITKYKSQRREVQRKLALTKNDLVRIADLITEVEMRAASLSRQARMARRYEEGREEINRLSLLLARRDYGRLKNRLDQIGEEVKALKERISQEQISGREVSQGLDAVIEKLRSKGGELSLQREKLAVLSRKVNALRGDISLSKEKMRGLGELALRERREEERLQLRIAQIQKEGRDVKGELKTLIPKIGQSQEEESRGEERLSRLEEKFLTLRGEATALRKELTELMDDYRGKISEKERLSTELGSITSQEERLRGEEAETGERLGTIKTRQGESKSKWTTLTGELEKVEKDLAKERESYRMAEERLKSLMAQEERLKGLISSLDSQTKLLEELVREREGLSPGTKALLGKEIPGVRGALADLIDVEEGYEKAIEGALGQAAQYLIVEDSSLAQKCLLLLKRDKSGRATLIPLDEIPHPGASPLLPPRALGWAKDLVGCDPEYRPVLEFLLDRFVVVKEIPSHPQDDLNWVNLNGETRHSWGMMSGGSNQIGFPLIGRGRRLAQLLSSRKDYAEEWRSLGIEGREVQETLARSRERIAVLESEKEGIKGGLQEVERQLDRDEFLSTELIQKGERVKSRLEETLERKRKLEGLLAPILKDLRALEGERGKREDELRGREDLLERVDTERRELSRELNKERMELITLEGRRQDLEGRLERIVQLQEELKDNIQEKKKEGERIRREREEIRVDLGELEKQLARLSTQEGEERKRLEVVAQEEKRLKEEWKEGEAQTKTQQQRVAEIDSRLHHLEVEYAQIEVQAEDLKRRVKGDYKVEVEEIQGPTEEITPEQIEALKERLRRQGPVNLLALDEYQKEKERLGFLRSQKDDLEKAETSLEKTIAKLDYTAREKFLQTFEKINTHFQDVFRELFSGGEAHLRLKPGADPLEAGVEISVSPEGKRLFNLGQLSGGEKALTTIAFLFSLYLIKPSPFCILDEVDAPLDDGNVERFLRLVRRFSRDSQFIVITHNKRTMAEADLLYGITMEEPGVSKLVSVKVKGN